MIEKATPTATLVVNNSPQVYNTLPQAATVSITVSSVPGTVANILTGGAATKTNAGTYAVTADFVPDDTSNYNSVIGLSAGNFKIDKGTPTATLAVSNSPQIYNGSSKAATVAITASSVPGVVANILTGGAPTQTNVGNYAVTADFVPTDSANYNTLTGLSAGNFMIDKAPVTAKAGSGSATYDSTTKSPSGCMVTGIYTGDLTCANNPNSVGPNAGTTAIVPVVSGTSLQNFEITSVNGSYTINKAPSTTVVTCPASVVYNGSAQTPCSVSVTGAGGLNLTPVANYSNNISAGTATAGYTFVETANHLGSSDSKTFEIAKAATVTTVTCDPGPFTYNGSPHTPCTAQVTGPGLIEALTVSYANNVNAGTATGSATYAETANYLGSSDIKSFTIEKATSFTTVSCPSHVVYNGFGQEPCSATVIGVGLKQSLTVSYLNNINAGAATASASYAGDANHNGSSDTKYFTIEKAASVTTVTFEPGPYMYRGTPFIATAVVMGVGGLNQALAVVYTGNCTQVTVVNGCTATATYAGDANHHGSSDSKSITITTAFAYSGFYPPIGGSVEYGNGGSYANPLKTFKLNSTIPVKFSATWLNGGAPLITGIHKLQAVKYSNATTVDGDPIDATPTDAATTGNQFRVTGADWHFNLSTKGLTAGTWLLIATLEDGSKYSVWISIKR
jgi:hypothetical protein